MGYATFEKLCALNNVRPSDVSKSTGIATATLTSWKQGKYTPKPDKLQKIADFFGVSLEYLRTGKEPDHVQDLFVNDPNLRALLEAAKDASPEDLKLITELLQKLCVRAYRKAITEMKDF